MNEPTIHSIEVAQGFWTKLCQYEIWEGFKGKKYDRLGAYLNDDGVICVGERMKGNIWPTQNKTPLALLPYKHKFSDTARNESEQI